MMEKIQLPRQGPRMEGNLCFNLLVLCVANNTPRCQERAATWMLRVWTLVRQPSYWQRVILTLIPLKLFLLKERLQLVIMTILSYTSKPCSHSMEEGASSLITTLPLPLQWGSSQLALGSSGRELTSTKLPHPSCSRPWSATRAISKL
jgi:hypothetical protein